MKTLIYGAIAQLGEHLLCTQEVGGSIPPGSTIRGAGDVAVTEDYSIRVQHSVKCEMHQLERVSGSLTIW